MLLFSGQVSVIINSNCQVTQNVVRIATSIMAVGQSQPLSYLPGSYTGGELCDYVMTISLSLIL